MHSRLVEEQIDEWCDHRPERSDGDEQRQQIQVGNAAADRAQSVRSHAGPPGWRCRCRRQRERDIARSRAADQRQVRSWANSFGTKRNNMQNTSREIKLKAALSRNRRRCGRTQLRAPAYAEHEGEERIADKGLVPASVQRGDSKALGQTAANRQFDRKLLPAVRIRLDNERDLPSAQQRALGIASPSSRTPPLRARVASYGLKPAPSAQTCIIPRAGDRCRRTLVATAGALASSVKPGRGDAVGARRRRGRSVGCLALDRYLQQYARRYRRVAIPAVDPVPPGTSGATAGPPGRAGNLYGVCWAGRFRARGSSPRREPAI